MVGQNTSKFYSTLGAVVVTYTRHGQTFDLSQITAAETHPFQTAGFIK